MPATPAETAKAATIANALDSRQTTLIGTVTRPETRFALIRHPGGRISRLSVGDPLDGATVTAIDDGTLLLSRKGITETLTLPRG